MELMLWFFAGLMEGKGIFFLMLMVVV